MTYLPKIKVLTPLSLQGRGLERGFSNPLTHVLLIGNKCFSRIQVVAIQTKPAQAGLKSLIFLLIHLRRLSLCHSPCSQPHLQPQTIQNKSILKSKFS